MIPDFKTYIRESIWSDMQERGTGDMTKAEDNVDNLDFFDFMDYIDKHYNVKSDYLNVGSTYKENIPYELRVVVMFRQYYYGIDLDYSLKKNDDKKHVLITNNVSRHEQDLYKELKNKYDVYPSSNYDSYAGVLEISPKDGSETTNHFYLEVLDFIIDSKPQYLMITKKEK